MNNQQAINLLKGLEQRLDDYCELNDEGKTAFGMAITALELFGNSERLPSAQPEPCEDAGEKTCRTCHLWEDGEINIACPWGSNYEHYEDDYCSLWEKQN